MSRGQLERGSGAEGRVCAGQSDGADTSGWLVTETLCGNTLPGTVQRRSRRKDLGQLHQGRQGEASGRGRQEEAAMPESERNSGKKGLQRDSGLQGHCLINPRRKHLLFSFW